MAALGVKSVVRNKERLGKVSYTTLSLLLAFLIGDNHLLFPSSRFESPTNIRASWKTSNKEQNGKRYFREILLEDKVVSEKLTEKEIDEALNPRNYLGTALEQVELMVKKTREEREARGLV